MNAFTVTQSYLLLTGSMVLAVVIVRISLFINDYRRKRHRKKKIKDPVWFPANEYTSRDSEISFIGDKTPDK
ncbi:hypothetical protein ZQ34_003711 [Salmonella enterica subsp. salamae]|nr:hypothetical protein [Salmonella enterica subsp. salamae]